MIKKAFHKLSLFWKVVLLFVMMVSFFSGVLLYMYFAAIRSMGDIDSAVLSGIQMIGLQAGGLLLIATALVILFYYRDSLSFITRINGCLKEALDERGLATNFTDFFNGLTFDDISTNTQSIFSLFKSFDNIKVARISSETNSIKIIINNINEGVLLVNKERIVTHINHPSEMMLRLIPGEIIDQIISRKISHKLILDNLDYALDKGQKVTDVEVSLKDNDPFILNIFPVKNKFGEIIRAIVILEKKSDNSSVKK